MEHSGRRGRRNRARSQQARNASTNKQGWLEFIYNYFLLACVISVLYLMMEYHCTACNAKAELKNIAQNLKNISKNLTIMKKGYEVLEDKMNQFSLELPKIEGQLEVLEMLASKMDCGDRQYDLKLPNVDLFKTPITQKTITNVSTSMKDFNSIF